MNKRFFFHFHFDKHFRLHKNTKMKSSTCYVCGSIILCILKFWPIKKHKNKIIVKSLTSTKEIRFPCPHASQNISENLHPGSFYQ